MHSKASCLWLTASEMRDNSSHALQGNLVPGCYLQIPRGLGRQLVLRQRTNIHVSLHQGSQASIQVKACSKGLNAQASVALISTRTRPHSRSPPAYTYKVPRQIMHIECRWYDSNFTLLMQRTVTNYMACLTLKRTATRPCTWQHGKCTSASACISRAYQVDNLHRRASNLTCERASTVHKIP